MFCELFVHTKLTPQKITGLCLNDSIFRDLKKVVESCFFVISKLIPSRVSCFSHKIFFNHVTAQHPIIDFFNQKIIKKRQTPLTMARKKSEFYDFL